MEGVRCVSFSGSRRILHYIGQDIDGKGVGTSSVVYLPHKETVSVLRFHWKRGLLSREEMVGGGCSHVVLVCYAYYSPKYQRTQRNADPSDLSFFHG